MNHLVGVGGDAKEWVGALQTVHGLGHVGLTKANTPQFLDLPVLEKNLENSHVIFTLPT